MIGDKVICIDNKNGNNSVSLTIGKSYTIREFDVYDYNIDVINDDGDIGQYRMQRFTTLETWREQQLNKLFNE